MLVLDIETTNLDKGAAWNDLNSIVYWYCMVLDGNLNPVAELDGRDLASLVECVSHHGTVIAHNAKFEASWLLRGGLPIHRMGFIDTMMYEWVFQGNRRWDKSLNGLARYYLRWNKNPVVDRWMKSGVCPSEMPRFMVEERCKLDVKMTLEIFKKQQAKYPHLYALFLYRCALINPLTEMEMTGMKLDAAAVKKEYIETEARLAELQAILHDIGGDVNLGSPKQRAELIYGDLKFVIPKDYTGQKMVTSSGYGSTDAYAIDKLKAKTKKQKLFKETLLEEAKLRSKKDKFLKPFRKAVEENDGVLHGSLQQGIAATHRLTSANPNLQNFDRTLRHLFVSHNPDWLIRKSDYAQLEYRSAGYLARDNCVLTRSSSGFDVHAYTADIIFGEHSPAARTRAKSRTFKPLYGGSSGTDAERHYYQQFMLDHKGIKEWQERVKRHRHYLTELGMYFYFDGLTPQQKVNYPVQNFAGEIAALGCIHTYHKLKNSNLSARLINFVHDELVIEHPEDESEKVEEIVNRCMVDEVINTLAMLGAKYDYPLTIETQAKRTW